MKAANDNHSRLVALIIDDHANQRQQLRWHLTQLGVGTVDQAGTALEALNAITRLNYDLILCDYNLDSNSRGIASNGQQLLEHARSNGLLGPGTIFIMVSGNNNYMDIAATVEQKPDAYLVKPITTKTLDERLQRLLDRQRALAPIAQRHGRGDHAGAVQAADEVIADKPEYTLQALQTKGDSQLELAAFEDAIATFDRALAISAKLDWAHHGKARAYKGLKQIGEARQVLEALVARNPLYTPAYELLAVMAEEEGNDHKAMAVLQRSLEELPSPRRARVLAEVAYRNGEVEVARSHYEQVLKSTKGTFVARTSDVLMLAQSAIDMGDHKDALKLVAENGKEIAKEAALEGVASSLQAQAYVALGDMESARQAAENARRLAGPPSPSLHGLLVAKGLLAVGDRSGLDMLKACVKADHENAKMLNLARKVLKDTGNEAQAADLIDAVADSVRTTLDNAQKLRRAGDFAKAREMVDMALAELPDNTGVLIEASQVYLLALMRQPQKDADMVRAVARFLDRLDQLLPGSDRVAALRAYFRRTLQPANS